MLGRRQESAPELLTQSRGTSVEQKEVSIEEKRDRVLSMLESGRAEIVFYPENDHIDIVLVES